MRANTAMLEGLRSKDRDPGPDPAANLSAASRRQIRRGFIVTDGYLELDRLLSLTEVWQRVSTRWRELTDPKFSRIRTTYTASDGRVVEASSDEAVSSSTAVTGHLSPGQWLELDGGDPESPLDQSQYENWNTKMSGGWQSPTQDSLTPALCLLDGMLLKARRQFPDRVVAGELRIQLPEPGLDNPDGHFGCVVRFWFYRGVPTAIETQILTNPTLHPDAILIARSDEDFATALRQLAE
tara:strand:+ start:535 stop:1251 length:717 start_codon:yes stop_codon:yes gene_type:complete